MPSKLIISAPKRLLDQVAAGHFAGGVYVWQIVNGLVSFAIITLIFALIFKVVPDVEIGWGDVLVGAVATAVLFTAGKYLLGLYLGRASVTSPYGAAGSLVVILIWVYYSAQILLFGAEFTRVYARHYGTHIHPSPNAVALTCQDRAEQGTPTTQELEVAFRNEHKRPA